MIKRAELLIFVISNNIIIYKCRHCGKEHPYDKMMVKFDRCPRCNLKWKNKARIIRSNDLHDVKKPI